MATYDLSIGLKKVNWHFDNNESIKVMNTYCSAKYPTKFTLTFFSTFGSSIFDLEISYLAVDSSLTNYIYTLTGGNYLAFSAQSGTTWPVNHTLNPSYSGFAWANYKSTTKVLIYSTYYKYNPGLSTANHSLGQYLTLNTVSTSSFIPNVVIPFGGDNFTRFDSMIIYINPP